MSKEAVIVSKLGVPRFAVDNVLKILNKQYSDIVIDIENMSKIKQAILKIQSNEYIVDNTSGIVVKKIVDSRIS